jgi:hypothetical protein
MTWAISPPITPAPTTPALKTNMAATLAERWLRAVHQTPWRRAMRLLPVTTRLDTVSNEDRCSLRRGQHEHGDERVPGGRRYDRRHPAR